MKRKKFVVGHRARGAWAHRIRRRLLGFERLEIRNMLTLVTLSPVADTTLYEDGDFANGAGDQFFAGATANQNQGLLRRALLKFDVAAAIPSGATINSVTLRLTMTKTPNPIVSTAMSLHEVSADWGEGTTNASGQEGTGGAATANSATWRHRFFSATTWNSQGGDFSATASATTAVVGLGNYEWAGSGLVASVQKWLNSPSSQFGWLLKATSESTVKNAKRFASRENANAASRPLLTVDYTIAASNQPPTLDNIPNPTPIPEDSSQQTVNLTGISAGPGETQAITVTAISNNSALIPNPTVVYTSPNGTGTLNFSPQPNQFGTAVITVTVRDNGGTANGGVDTVIKSFTVTVNAVNDAPTLDAIPNPGTILEDAGQQTINLSGISAGPGESQTLTVSAVSSNPSLIPNPSVIYTSPNATGSLSYTPVANQSGTAIVTVTVNDNGGTTAGGIDSVTRTFTITVNPVNDAPTLDSIANPAAILEDATSQTVNLSGITAGPSETQALTVTAVSNNPGLVPNPVITYTSANSTGTLVYSPVADQSGTAIITVTVTDNGGTNDGGVNSFSRSFTITVNPVNDAPKVDAIPNPSAVLEDAGQQTINLSGISAGPGESQTLTVSAVSSNPSLIPNPSVIYTSPNATGSLSYTPVANQSGTAIFTVTVKDSGGVVDGGADTFARTFTVTVESVNDAPTMDPITDPPVILEDAGQQTIKLSGITAGPNESQALIVTAVSSNPALVSNPLVNYASGNNEGSLSFTPVANQAGTATITVTVKDDGGTANSGVDLLIRSFTITVTPVNDAPSLDPIADPAPILENSSSQSVVLSGISAGPNETQSLTVTAVSSNPQLIPNPTVEYTSANPSGTLMYQPTANQIGTATITVSVTDNGGIANNGINTITRSFVVTVTQVNRAPTLDALANLAVLEDAVSQTVVLAGISAGVGETQPQSLTVTATSSNPALVPDPTVTYSSPAASGSVAFKPSSNQTGTAVITITVKDNGGTAGGGIDSISRSFTVTVDPVNDAPTLDPIADPATILKGAGQQLIQLKGISAGPNESQRITVSAKSSNPGLIPDPDVTYVSPAVSGSLTYTPVPAQAGSATITVTVSDDGGTDNGGANSISRTFTVTVSEVNLAPTLDEIPNPPILLEDAGVQTIKFSGISAGQNEVQNLTISAVSLNPGLIPNPTVNYASPNATGSLEFTPAANQSGTAAIVVTVRDDGGTANGGIDVISRTFTVNLQSVNDAPTLDAIPNPQPIRSNQGTQVISLSGISAGPLETQELSVAAASNNPALIPNPLIKYTSANPGGTLEFAPLGNQPGIATITVSVTDSGGTENGGVNSVSRTFLVEVIPANLPPTLDLTATSVVIPEDSASQSLVLNGITAGGTESQPLAVVVSSDNPTLIAAPTVTYSSPQSNGLITYVPISNQHGVAILTVTVEDGGLDGDLGTKQDNATFSRQVTITVNAVNDSPTTAGDSFKVNQGAITVLDLFANDADIDSAINPNSVEFKSGPANGKLLINGAGRVEYHASSSYFGQDSFAYRVADTQGAFSNFVDVALSVNAIPIAVGETKYLNAGSPTDIDVLENDRDPDGKLSELTIVVSQVDPNVGELVITPTNLIRFTAGQAFAGSVQLRYRLRDALGGESAEAIADLGVYNQNPRIPEDVNNSGQITPLDVLFIINTLNVEGGRQIPPGNHVAPFYDVNADRFVTPLDALLIINYLNSRAVGEGEQVAPELPAPKPTFSTEKVFVMAETFQSSPNTDLNKSEFRGPSITQHQSDSGHSASRVSSLEKAIDHAFGSLDEWLEKCLIGRS